MTESISKAFYKKTKKKELTVTLIFKKKGSIVVCTIRFLFSLKSVFFFIMLAQYLRRDHHKKPVIPVLYFSLPWAGGGTSEEELLLLGCGSVQHTEPPCPMAFKWTVKVSDFMSANLSLLFFPYKRQRMPPH